MTVPAGESKTVLAPVPPDVQGVITVTVDDETILKGAGTLVCGDEAPPGFDGDDDKAAGEVKGGQLPFTGSTTGLIVGTALAIVAAGSLTLAGLRLFAHATGSASSKIPSE